MPGKDNQYKGPGRVKDDTTQRIALTVKAEKKLQNILSNPYSYQVKCIVTVTANPGYSKLKGFVLAESVR